MLQRMIFTPIFLVCLFSLPIFAEAFTDVPRNYDYSYDVEFLYDRGSVQGYADFTFHPNSEVIRAEALAMIFKSAGIQIDDGAAAAPFKDVTLSDWFYPMVNTAYKKGLISGNPDSTFKPREIINMAEALKMTTNIFFRQFEAPDYKDDPLLAMNRNDWFASYFLFAKEKGIINKFKYYHPAKLLTRGELSSIMHRMILVQEGDFAAIREFNEKKNSEYRLFIPKLNIVDVPVNYVADFTDYNQALNVLWNGVGNFRYQPGDLGKIVIYGHSSYYAGSKQKYRFVFRDLDQLVPGDRLYINYQNKGYIYEVTATQIVNPNHLEVLQSYGVEELALFTCYPRDSIRQRYIVNGKRVPDPE